MNHHHIINENVLSIPPYISTGWQNIVSLSMTGEVLIITLTNNEVIEIPKLKEETLTQIFESHAKFLEKKANTPTSQERLSPPFSAFQMGMDLSGNDLPIKFGIAPLGALGQGMGDLGQVMQHNPSQANAPNLPEEVIEKIAAISKIIIPDDPQAIPKPEPHCNCPYCQIARTIQQSKNKISEKDNEESEELEPITEEDLKFQQWDIKKAEDKLYIVTNKLEPTEEYRVFLGNPVGCTCGKSGCEHILAVLRD